jgi:hypothetical protein
MRGNYGIKEHDAVYRRGLVLGLTMAEMCILVIFILLLVLGTWLSSEQARREELEVQVQALRELLPELPAGKDFDTFVNELTLSRKVRAELEAARKRIAELEAAAERGGLPRPISPEAVERTVADGKAFAQMSKIVDPAHGGDLVRQLAQAKSENERLQGQLASQKRILDKIAGGKGTEKPACWATADGKPEYIFDVALTSTGLIVRDRKLPHRAEQQATLPLSSITYEIERAPAIFLQETKALLDWSNAHDCRFFVRVYDLTRGDEKVVYKAHLRTLEDRFYKLEILSEIFRR